LSSRETHQRDKAKRWITAVKVEETETSLPRRTNLLRTSEKARKMNHRRSIHAFYAMDLTRSLNVLKGASLLPLSKRKRSKRRREGLPPSNYSMPFKPR